MDARTLVGLSDAPPAPRSRGGGPPSSLARDDLVSRLKQNFSSPDYKPPLLPAIAMQLVSLSRDPDVDLAKVARLMEAEPMILGHVMRIAQSPFYARGTPVETIDEAIVRLGLKNLSSIVVEAALNVSIFDSEAFAEPMENLRKHSVATGHMAREICHQLEHSGDRAFLCGLLHDAGMAAAIIGAAELDDSLRLEDIETELVMVHEDASGILGRCWELPPGISWVLSHHHHYQIGDHVSPIAAIVCLADWLVSEAGAAALPDVEVAPALRAAEYFGFDRGELAALGRVADAIVREIRSRP